MSTILPLSDVFSSTVKVPNPLEPVRAGAGAGATIDGDAVGNNINGVITYTGLQAGVNIRLLGGVSKTLAVTVVGLDVIVQLGTNNVGTVTSNATAVVGQIQGTPAAAALVTAVVSNLGNGTGFPSAMDSLPVGTASLGSVRPPFETLANNTFYSWNRALEQRNYNSRDPLHHKMVLVKQAGNTIDRGQVPSFYGYTGTPEVVTFFNGISPFTLSVADLEGGGAFGINTWYYVYLDTTFGVGVDVINTTVPMTEQNYQNANAKRRYVGAFRTDGSGNLKLFRKIGRRTVYLQPIVEHANISINTVGSPNSFPLFWCVPGGIGTSSARLRLEISNSDTQAQSFYWEHDSTVGSFYTVPIPAQTTVVQEITVASTAIPQVLNFSAYASAANKITLTVHMMEFYE